MWLASKVPRGAPALPLVFAVLGPGSEGGGATIAGAPSVGAEEYRDRAPESTDTPTVGGGATTLSRKPVAEAVREPRELSLGALAPTVGPFELTAGGGGTTSVAPKIFPIRLLMKDPLPGCAGGGGTTVFEGSEAPPTTRCASWARSAEGGGATTD